jgi:hypothetical protein
MKTYEFDSGGEGLRVKACERHPPAALLRGNSHQQQHGRCLGMHQHRHRSKGREEKYLPLLRIEAWSSSPKFNVIIIIIIIINCKCAVAR